MTREEAIKIIDCYDIGFYDLSGEKIPAYKLMEAFDMAVESLQSNLVLDIVRCKDCRWWSGSQETMHNNHLCRNWSKFGSISTSADDFCSYGVPKTI